MNTIEEWVIPELPINVTIEMIWGPECDELICDLGQNQFEELNKILEETNKNNKCTCDMTTLMRTGCTCGGS